MANDIDFIAVSWSAGQVMRSTSIVDGGSSLAAARVKEGAQLVFFPKASSRHLHLLLQTGSNAVGTRKDRC
jgi:hypothetical protein